MSHDYGLKCERCGAWMDLRESAMGGLCHKCRDKLAEEMALMDDEKRPPDVAAQKTPQMRDKRGNILLRAHEVINGERQERYGQPEDCFGSIAALWNAYLRGKAQAEDDGDFYSLSFPSLAPQDVAVMMALLKIARMQHGAGGEDSYVDACGYIALASDMEK